MNQHLEMEAKEELDLLRQRVQEAEETCLAIARGEVDAFVIGQKDEQKRVLLLAGAYQRYRQLVEHMQQGAVTCSPQGDILYANQRFAAMLDVPLSSLYAAPLESYVAAPDRARLSAFLMLSARGSRIDVILHRRDGHVVPVRLSLTSFGDGYASILVTEQSLPQRMDEIDHSLNAIRDALEVLNRVAANDEAGRQAAKAIGAEINSLARLADELRDEQRRTEA
jgi:PAS domain S-box-containing protein